MSPRGAAVLDGPSFHMPVDAFHAMRTRPELPPARLTTALHTT